MAAFSLSDSYQPIRIGGFEKIQTQDILFCQGDRNYTHVHLVNGRKITVSQTLSLLEERLMCGDFLRVNRGRLINMLHIKTYDDYFITLTNGTLIAVARRRRLKVRVSLRLFSEKVYIKEKRCA
jgi:DNA-binding LytR/AlgR family response regulator